MVAGAERTRITRCGATVEQVSRVQIVEPDRALRRRLRPLFDAAAAADGRPALSDHLLVDLDAGTDGAIGALVEAAGAPVAYGQASRANEGFTAEIVVEPDHRGDPTLMDDLVAALLNEISEAGGGSVDWWIHRPTDGLLAVAERHRMVPVRSLHRMAASLPVARHADVQTRAFDPARDEEAWLAVNNRAFAGHGEQGGWTLAMLRRREAEDWFDPDGFRLHERDGRLAAFCWTKVHPSDPDFDGEPAGEIYVIAVDPDFHGHGLGSQLTLAGLDHLAGRGLQHAILYVDAGNDVAVTMYERLGFSIDSTSVAARRQVGR